MMERSLSAQLRDAAVASGAMQRTHSTGAPTLLRSRSASGRITPLRVPTPVFAAVDREEAAQPAAAAAAPEAAKKGAQPAPEKPRRARPSAAARLALAAAVLAAGALLVAGPSSPLLPPRIAAGELPLARPPAWDYCSWDCAASSSLERRPNGAIVATVAHRPLAGVTPEMLRWWFDGGVEGDMTLDGTTYSRYLVWVRAPSLGPLDCAVP
jgi:hypothetical protein